MTAEPVITFKTGSPSYREGEFTLIVRPGDDTRLIHRVFIHRREWRARVVPDVSAEFLAAFHASDFSKATASRTVVPGTLVTLVTWQLGNTTTTAFVGDRPEDLQFQKLAEQIIDQIAPGILDLGPWRTTRTLLVEASEILDGSHSTKPTPDPEPG